MRTRRLGRSVVRVSRFSLGAAATLDNPLAMKAATPVLTAPGRLTTAQKAAALGGRLVARKGVIGPLSGPRHGWSDTRDTPAPPRESFRAWWQRTHPQHSSGDQ